MNKFTYLWITILFMSFTLSVNGQVVINEILTSNTNVNQDEDGTYQDWVELYNSGASAVNLNGYGLTDDATLPFKWTFPAVTMAPNSYLLVWCSDKNRTVVGQPLHTNWKISSSGEVVTLTNASSVTVDSSPATSIPSDISYGRIPNGTGSFMFIQAVTPGAANGSVGYTEILPVPTFSQTGGFSSANFDLTISTTVAGATIIYTLDGSEPDPNNLAGTTYQYKNVYPQEPGDSTGPLLNQTFRSFTYTAPIAISDRTSQPNKISAISSTYHNDPDYIPEFNVFKGTVVRAKVIKAGALSSKTATKDYFVNPEGAGKFTLPVLSISMNENQLFDYNEGIYTAGIDFDNWRTAHPTWLVEDYEDLANYYRRGIENERVANMSYFVNGAEVLNQDIGFRIHGGSSRDYANKSFNIYARSEYGDDDIDYQFFSDKPLNVFKRLTARNSGNDFNQTMFRDGMNQFLTRNLNITTKGFQQMVTFINGEYWGLLNMIEKVDDDFFETTYNIDKDEVDIIELEGVLAGGIEAGDNVKWLEMMDYAEANSLVSDTNYQQMLTMMDPESFMDYYITNIFLMNEDWPGNNVVLWRKRVAYTPNAAYGHDGRFRWILHDTDATYAIDDENFNMNTLNFATVNAGEDAWPNPEWSTRLLRKMLQNPTFKNAFITRFADLLNTTFLSPRILAKIEEMKAEIAPEMPDVFARWESPIDNGDWNYFLNIEKEFATVRPNFQRNHIRNKFTIANNINVTLNVSDAAAGYVKINTIDIKDGTDGITGNPYPWTGIYFSNIPVTLKAVANPGYAFSHWEGASTATTAEITLTSDAALSATAVFTPVVVAVSEPIYFWFMDGNIVNDTPLTSLNTTFELEGVDGSIQYESCLVGYPFTSADPNWRKASMERRNKPTPINYIPEANGGAPYVAGNMKAIQITEPLQSGSLGNTMVFNFSTAGYEKIIFSFAAMNELTNATGILVDYSVNTGTPIWITTGLASTTLPISAAFELFTVDFSSIATADNNANFKVRLRFTGSNMEVSAGNRITFNNIAVHGTLLPLANPGYNTVKFEVYPNPVSETLNVLNINADADYRIFSIDGKLVKSGKLDTAQQINMESLNRGMYLLQLTSEGRSETKKIIKN